ILAFGFDPSDGGLLDFLEGWREARAERAEEMVVKLRAQGLDLTMEHVREQAGGDILTRAHLGRALEAEGLVPDQETAFGKYLSRGRPAFRLAGPPSSSPTPRTTASSSTSAPAAAGSGPGSTATPDCPGPV
ncbi:MAG: hypothetical protein ABEJ46_05820, partial [Gemmatimonadota bacterium]